MKKRAGQAKFILAFLAPALALYSIFVLVPLTQTIQLSFYSFRGVSSNKRWNGFDNYTNLLKDDVFRQTLWNLLGFTLVGGTVVFIIGLALAHLLQSNSKWAKAIRAMYLLPHVLSVVAVAVLFRFIYLPGGGLLPGFGMHGPSDGWLGSTKTALPSVVTAWIWYAFGFYAMLFSAGLQTIDNEALEAAQLDGATGWRRFTHVTFPLLFTVRRMATIYIVVHVANVFALVNVMTDGGPARSTETLLTYLYQSAFTNTKMGYANAIATVNLLIVIALTALISLIYRRDPQEPKLAR